VFSLKSMLKQISPPWKFRRTMRTKTSPSIPTSAEACSPLNLPCQKFVVRPHELEHLHASSKLQDMYCLAKRRDWWLVVSVYVIFIVGSPRSADCQRQEHRKLPSFPSSGSITKGEEGRREGEEKKRTEAIRPQGTLSIVEPRHHGIVDCERVYITGVLPISYISSLNILNSHSHKRLD
jgi:hypothetical protein